MNIRLFKRTCGKNGVLNIVLYYYCLAKNEAPKFKRPICKDPPCLKRKIRVKVYIEDMLWGIMAEIVTDPTEIIIEQLVQVFEEINKNLDNLDNGGYMIDFDKKVVKLENSDIVLQDSYVDRWEGNVTKAFDPDKILAFTFAFQESVALLRNRNEVDLRILMIYKRKQDPGPEIGTAEEECLCNPHTFACIAIFAIQQRHLSNWAYHMSIFTHEIGHTLGMKPHDDKFYHYSEDLIMWSGVERNANVWSPEAKKRINEHDNSCLATVDPSR